MDPKGMRLEVKGNDVRRVFQMGLIGTDWVLTRVIQGAVMHKRSALMNNHVGGIKARAI
jgi:hypothetical protein